MIWASRVFGGKFPPWDTLQPKAKEGFEDIERHFNNAVSETKATAHRVWAGDVTKLERANRRLNEENVELNRKLGDLKC